MPFNSSPCTAAVRQMRGPAVAPCATITGVVTTVPSKLWPDAHCSSARVPGRTDWPSTDSVVSSSTWSLCTTEFTAAVTSRADAGSGKATSAAGCVTAGRGGGDGGADFALAVETCEPGGAAAACVLGASGRVGAAGFTALAGLRCAGFVAAGCGFGAAGLAAAGATGTAADVTGFGAVVVASTGKSCARTNPQASTSAMHQRRRQLMLLRRCSVHRHRALRAFVPGQ